LTLEILPHPLVLTLTVLALEDRGDEYAITMAFEFPEGFTYEEIAYMFRAAAEQLEAAGA